MRSRRALLYVPGNNLKMLTKATGLGADGVMLDLEDGVAANRKDEARDTILEALKTLDFGRSERLVRINPLYSQRAEQDLHAVLPGRPDGIVIPKVSEAGIIQKIDQLVSNSEQELGLEPGRIVLLALVESAVAFMNLPSICQASPRLQGLIFGAEDLCADTGITRTSSGQELLYARSALVMSAAAFGLQAIDMVQTNFTDLDLLEKEVKNGVELGFSGKQVIHPNQIKVVQKAFTPSQEAIEQARRVVNGAQVALAKGNGAYSLDGEMVDLPVVKRAEAILARARAAGVIEQE